MQSFLTKRTNAGCSPTTVQLDGKILRSALNQARREGLISVNPAEAAELPERNSVERGTFTAAEVKMLADAAHDEWRTLVLFGYFTGARLSDCCKMEWKTVNLAQGTLIYRQGKTGKEVAIPLHPIFNATWRNWRPRTSRSDLSCRGWRTKDRAVDMGSAKGLSALSAKLDWTYRRSKAAASAKSADARFMRCVTALPAPWQMRRSCPSCE